MIEANLHDTHAAEPGKCGLCKSKMRLFPPYLDLNLPLGAMRIEMCERCETGLKKLAGLAGNRPLRLNITGQEGQTEMFDDLADAVPQNAEVWEDQDGGDSDDDRYRDDRREIPQLEAGEERGIIVIPDR